jgi:DeoR/GlpR family transcriptional regulator of sugar metabolism
MLIAERHARLEALIARRGMADLDTLCAELNVSQSTIRRDLEALESRGVVRRTHGGVICVGHTTQSRAPYSYAFDQRMGVLPDAKRRIAKAAAAIVEAGQTVLIDGGTTTFYLAQELLHKSLQIVTNSLPIANVFLNVEGVELILTGGVLYPRYGVLLGPMADSTLSAVHATLMFLSVAGIHEDSLFNQNLLMVQTQRRMMEKAQKVVLLADSSKFGQQALARLGGLDEIDIVVSDAALDETYRKRIEAAGCELIVAAGD